MYFAGSADFRSVIFKASTWFEGARFIKAVPKFFAAELYEYTHFTLPEDFSDNWPPLTGEHVMAPEAQKKAYNRLRLFMNQSLQIDEEQFFHRMEMRCKRVGEDWRHRWIYTLFGVVSDYGNSVLRPAGWLLFWWLVGAVARLAAMWPDWTTVPQAMGWSFANLFAFLGFRGLYFAGEELHGALQFLSGVQTVFGVVLLFFLGLGLRNRFRLR